MPWEGGYSALSNFGFGGSNVHLLMHGKPAGKTGLINIAATDANLASLAPAQVPLVPSQPSALDAQTPLSSRTPAGLAKLAQILQVAPRSFQPVSRRNGCPALFSTFQSIGWIARIQDCNSIEVCHPLPKPSARRIQSDLQR